MLNLQLCHLSNAGQKNVLVFAICDWDEVLFLGLEASLGKDGNCARDCLLNCSCMEA